MVYVVFTMVNGSIEKHEFFSKYDLECFIMRFKAKNIGFIF